MNPYESEAVEAAKEMLRAVPYLDIRYIHDELQKRKITTEGRVSDLLSRHPDAFTRHQNGAWMLASIPSEGSADNSALPSAPPRA
jgi:hypothetical protein